MQARFTSTPVGEKLLITSSFRKPLEAGYGGGGGGGGRAERRMSEQQARIAERRRRSEQGSRKSFVGIARKPDEVGYATFVPHLILARTLSLALILRRLNPNPSPCTTPCPSRLGKLNDTTFVPAQEWRKKKPEAEALPKGAFV